ncbi:uncharacterized protein LOC114290060 isoform X3 [Camellia sinensis]|uniref:uncharacterized protein LOC114290060 isoform X3 n=1 Tax=Camellia sinensis TaxID=4442 RepID=UPI0010368404|nr:uncharacterized protein LOC114290060 isoform X3 [Camellia sinensis]
MGEEEEEQILERLRNQPIYSPPPSPTSVFLISPQLYFSQPPPLSPQRHFSPPPTTSVLGFSALPNFRSLVRIGLPPSRCQIIYITVFELHEFSFSGRKDNRNLSVTILPSPLYLSQYLEDYAQDFGGAVDVILMFLDEIPRWWWRWRWRQRLKLKSDLLSSLCVCEKEPDDIAEMTRTFVLESIPSGLFLPPKSPKMVSIWSCLSVVKISRKISIGLLQVLPSVQLPQTLHIVIVEEKMTRLLSCSGEFISQDSSLAEERSVEITVEVDATNNGAHGVKAYENFPIVSHSEKKNMTDKLKRNYKSISVLTRENLEQHFGSSREDVANSFGVSVSTMKRICRKHGISRWPFQPERKKERLTEVISPSMHEKHDSRLRCIQKPLHARSSPRTIALLDGGEMVQLDSSKQQSLVEFDVTTNSAHLVKASQSCSTVSHLDETNSRETLKRKCTTENVLSFEDLQQHFGCKLDDAAKALGVSVSTVKRISRQHGIPRWPSHKKRKVSKTDCILLEPQGEKDVSSTCSQMPTDGQTERGNEMVGQLQDQNEGPNLLNTENGSNKESITTLIFEDSVPEGEKNVSPTCKTPIVGIVLDFIKGPNLSNTENHSNKKRITTPTFLDSVPVFERDCILLEPQGEKNASPTHKTPTNGQTEVANGMVGHIRDQNGIVPEFIEGPNLSNIENRSNEKSLTTPNFQDSAPGNYPAMDFSISSTYRESGEAGGSSELAFQPKELTQSTAYPNPDTCMFTQPHISLREMLIENVGSSKDSRNFPTSAMGFLTGGLVSESSWTMPLCSDQAPMQTMTTIPHTMPHLTEKQDIRTVTFKAQYRDKKIKFRLSLSSGIVELKKEVTNRLGELGIFEVHYQDNDNEWILIGCDTDVLDCFELSSSSGNEVVRLLVRD